MDKKNCKKEQAKKRLSIIVIKEVLAKYISQISDDYFYADFEKNLLSMPSSRQKKQQVHKYYYSKGGVS